MASGCAIVLGMGTDFDSQDELRAIAAYADLFRAPSGRFGWRVLFVVVSFLGASITAVAYFVGTSDGPVKTLLAVICVFSFLAALFLAVVHPLRILLHENQSLNKDLTELRKSLLSREGFFQYAARMYGFTRNSVFIDMELKANGGAKTINTTVVRAINSGVDEIEHYSEGGNTGGNPGTDCNVRLGQCHYKRGTVRREVIDADEKVILWKVIFDPPMQPGDEATYTYIETSPPGTFNMDAEAVKRLTPPYEHLSHEIVYPCEDLTMKVTFPKGYSYAKNRKAEAWRDRGKMKQPDETARILSEGWLRTDQTTNQQHVLVFSVAHPILGMRYAVLWEPKLIKGKGNKKKPKKVIRLATELMDAKISSSEVAEVSMTGDMMTEKNSG